MKWKVLKNTFEIDCKRIYLHPDRKSAIFVIDFKKWPRGATE